MLESLILKVALLTGSLLFEIFNKFGLELRKDIPIISELSLNKYCEIRGACLCEVVFSVLMVKKSKY